MNRGVRVVATQLALVAAALGAFVVVAHFAKQKTNAQTPHASTAPAVASAPATTTTATTPTATTSSASAEPSALPAPSAAPEVDASTPFTTGDPTYREDDCETLSDVEAIRAAHLPGKSRATLDALAHARYPDGIPFIGAQTDAQLRTWLSAAPDSFDGLASRFEVVVHEGSHLWGFHHRSGRTIPYPVTRERTIDVRGLTTFPRSEIVSRHVDAANDSYVKTYLEGASGAQGFDTLLDEYNAYAHSLASRYCTRDLLPAGTRVSARDGILTMMFYVETYLAIARDEHPTDYAAILADAGHRTIVITVWNRAELWLRRSATFRALGVADDRIAGWVYDPARLAEIARVRDADAAKR